MRKTDRSTRGNVLFIILIAVALFGALTAAVTRSTSTVSPDTLTEGQAKIYASEIMQYGHEVEQAVTRLVTLKGCDPTQISFDENVSTAGSYDNTNSPSDYHCHVFQLNGGGVKPKAINPDWLDGKGGISGLYGTIGYFTTCVLAAGPPYVGNCDTNAPTAPQTYADLVVIIPYLKQEICQAIAEKLMGLDTIPVDSHNAFFITPFTGDFSVNTAHIDSGAGAYTAGCFTGNGASGATMMPAGRYAFFNVLLAR